MKFPWLLLIFADVVAPAAFNFRSCVEERDIAIQKASTDEDYFEKRNHICRAQEIFAECLQISSRYEQDISVRNDMITLAELVKKQNQEHCEHRLHSHRQSGSSHLMVQWTLLLGLILGLFSLSDVAYW